MATNDDRKRGAADDSNETPIDETGPETTLNSEPGDDETTLSEQAKREQERHLETGEENPG